MRPRDFLERGFLLRLGVLAAALAALGAAVVLSGVVPIRASSGHWPPTRWFLAFSMRRSVETWSLGVRVPELSDPALVVKGAAHYEAGCKPCHGAPGDERSGVARESTPEPPWLPDEVPRWDDAELFYIVKHGVKLTGMPAWPALERDDEVWAVVAFLRRLPELEEAGYRRLALGETADEGERLALVPRSDPPAPVLESCARCHGRDGGGRGEGAFPRLDGQKAEYLEAALAAYAAGLRRSGIMQPVASSLEGEALRQVARYYASRPAGALARIDGAAALPPGGEGPESPPGALELGERIALRGLPERKVPSCVDCHGPGEHERHPNYPLLAGQYPGYLALQLRLFKEGRRGGSPFHRIMHEVVRNLTPEQMEAVALWYGSLRAAPAATAAIRPPD